MPGRSWFSLTGRVAALSGVFLAACCQSAGIALTPRGQPAATLNPQPGGHDPTGGGWAARSEAYTALVALRDAERPSDAPQAVPPIRGLDTDRLVPVEAGSPSARLSLVEALGALRDRDPAAGQPAPGAPSEGNLVRAQRLYASGMAKLTAGEAAAAARDFAAAVQLDPGAASPWVKLAEAQARMGQGSASLLSRRKAADLGSGDAVSLAILGIQTARTGQHELAGHYLARCLDADPGAADPLLRQVALVRLADPLEKLGYLRASIEALQEGLVLPRQLRSPTRFGEDAADIARRASDLWLQIGDTACRLGDDTLAAEAYATAGATPSIDPGAILARRAFVLLRRGRGAAVGLLVLDDMASRDGRADARDLALLSILRDDAAVGPLLARAIDDLAASLPPAQTPSSRASLTLARAAVAPPRLARELLLEANLAGPADARLLDALFAHARDRSDLEQLAFDLVRARPADAEAVARSLLAWHPAPVTLTPRDPATPEAEIVRWHLLRAFHNPAERLESEAPAFAGFDGPLGAALVEARGLAAASAGAWGEVDAADDALTPDPVARARVLRAAQRHTAALRTLEPLLEGSHDLTTLLLAAQLSLDSGDGVQATGLLTRAKGLDPFDERAYEGLIETYQTLGDAPQAGAVIRELRDRIPSSHLLRWVNAQEEARRGLIDQAERSLRELVEDAPTNASALGLLQQIWLQRGSVEDTASLEDAARWLTAQTAEPPHSADAIAAHGRVLTLLDRFDEAEAILRAGQATRPSAVISRSLEDLLRAANRTEEADALAAERFAEAGPGLDASLERAEFLARAGRWSEVEPLVRAAMPDGAELDAAQHGRILALISALSNRAEQPETPTARDDALALLTLAQARGIDLPWQLSYSRWALLSTAPGATDAQIAEATDAFLAKIDSLEIANTIIGDTAARLAIPVDTIDLARSQIAYQLAGSLFASERADAALTVYRSALRLNPDHAWAANDLGYFLLERHENLDEAERLLEHAHALRPDQANIADSIAWLRYKLGQFDNQTLPDGTVRQGAISLLIAATGLPEGDTNATIHDHLGDALWRSGDRERASTAWIRAQQLLVGELAGLRDGGRSPRRDQLTEEQTRVGGKLDALRAGGEPRVAPLLEAPTDS